MKIYLKKSITLILALLFCASFLYAEGLEKGKKQLTGKASGSPSYTFLNINNISTWVYDNGNSDVTTTGDAGFIYPKGSGRNVFFESGPIWGGSMNGYYTIGGSAYRQGLTPGRVLPGTVADNPTNANVRIYRVRSDYKNFTDASSMADLFSSEVKDEGLTPEQIYAQYDLDWRQWPVAWGAPFIDKDGNGIYNPDIDIPGVSEEPCQTIWWVANDLDPSVTTYLYGGLPLKVEVQATFFAFKTTGPLGNTIFRKYKLINKNNIKFDSVYFCMWSDPDLGDAFDDFAGCDTLLSLGFVYNGQAHDNIYGDTPPASGFDFFQGPRIPGAPTDSAKFLGTWRKGYKGLGMGSFFYFSQGVEADFSDPTQGVYAAVKMWRNMFEGKLSRTGTPYIDPLTKRPTRYPLSGDPVSGTGWIDGILHAKNDRRFGQVSGPFTMLAGDTQEVVVGQLAAGASPGVGRIAAVSILKFYDKSAQGAYDNDFHVATPPVAPQVKVSELPASIILSWSDPTSYTQTENFAKSGFKFQGYNIYQFPQASSTIANAIRVATYDIADGISTIVSPTVDQTSGAVVNFVSAFGTDSGIKRYITITQDLVRGVPTLYADSRYYFAVAAYAYNPDPNAVPNVLESPLTILTCIPQAPLPGVRLSSATGDTLAANHTAGNSEGIVLVKVVDPKLGDGNTYTVTFPDETHYNILKGTTVVYANKPVVGVSSDNPIIAGAQFHVSPPPGQGLKSTEMVSGTNPWSTNGTGLWFVVGWHTNLWGGGLQLGYDFWYGGTYGTGTYGSSLTSFSQFHDVVLKFATTDATGAFSATDANASLGYRYMRAANGAAAQPSFVPFIKNKLSYGFQEFGLNGGPNIPISAYDQLTNKRLDVACFENNVAAGMVDGKYFPPLSAAAGGPGNASAREAFFILNTEYSATVKPQFSQLDRELLQNTTYGPLPIMYWIDAPRAKSFDAGDQIRINAYKIYSTADNYNITIPAATSSTDLQKVDVTNVNVFPNPYYGVNKQEINKYQRFVTFTHLPANATIKIFNIAGQLVRTLTKDATTGQFLRWDLSTDSGLPVASGIYVAYIDMPDQGVVKKLKVAIIQEQQILDRF